MTARRFNKRPSLESLVQRVDDQRPGDVGGDTIPTGFPSLDKILGGGLRRRDLVVLGGDVGAGKSALGLGIALRVAQQGTGVALLSGEMDEERIMGARSPSRSRGGGQVPRGDQQDPRSLGAAAGDWACRCRLAAGRGYKCGRAVGSLRQLGLVIVDYLQLVPPPTGAARTTQDEEVAVALRRLKAMALERQISCLVLAQLPRFEAARGDHRPTLDDYGHLGAVKQHADVVLSLYRPDMYDPGRGVEGATELLVSKNRNGPTGFVDLYFYRRWMRFEDMLDPDR
jgi:replicative DNA helicase